MMRFPALAALLVATCCLAGHGFATAEDGSPTRGDGAQRAQPAGPAQRGEASWYGEEFEGRKTATGERFDPDELTAAHPDLPLGSKAEVTNLETGKKVTVEINDRGPYAKGREIDLSKAAAKQLDMLHKGEAPVKIQPVK
jgi:rare lipoprotein A